MSHPSSTRSWWWLHLGASREVSQISCLRITSGLTDANRSWTMNLGPILTLLPGVKPNPQADGLGYNPRCISRDLSNVAAYETRDEMIVSLITGYKDVLSFQNRMQGDFPNKFFGVHTAGHFTIGGDAGTDFFNSPADPVSTVLSTANTFRLTL